MIKQRRNKLAIFCAHMVDSCRLGHILKLDSYDLNSQFPSIIILYIWHSCTAHTVHT